MRRLLESIVEECRGLKAAYPDIKEGYRFAKYLARDVKERSRLIQEGESSSLNNISLVLQLAEYQFAWADLEEQNENPHSLGIGIYAALHRKDHELLDGMYEHLVRQTREEKDVTSYTKPLPPNSKPVPPL